MGISQLVYYDLVIQNFDYLVADYGYTLLPSSENNYVVSYVSDDVTIDVMYDASRSFELDVRLGYAETRSSTEYFSLYEIVHMNGDKEFRTPQVTDERSVAKSLENCAMALKKSGDPLLRGDGFSFRRLSKYREQQSAEYAVTAKIRVVKADAETGWQNRNYSEVFSLLDSIRTHLSDAELKKLKYSQKKSGIK